MSRHLQYHGGVVFGKAVNKLRLFTNTMLSFMVVTFFEDLLSSKSAKSRGLGGNVGYVCCVGQNFTWVAWLTWV